MVTADLSRPDGPLPREGLALREPPEGRPGLSNALWTAQIVKVSESGCNSAWIRTLTGT